MSHERSSPIDESLREDCDPITHRFDRGERRAFAFAMTRKIDGNGIIAMMGELAGLQCPNTMVHAGAVDKQDRGLCRVEFSPGSEGKDNFSVDSKVHGLSSAATL